MRKPDMLRSARPHAVRAILGSDSLLLRSLTPEKIFRCRKSSTDVSERKTQARTRRRYGRRAKLTHGQFTSYVLVLPLRHASVKGSSARFTWHVNSRSRTWGSPKRTCTMTSHCQLQRGQRVVMESAAAGTELYSGAAGRTSQHVRSRTAVPGKPSVSEA